MSGMKPLGNPYQEAYHDLVGLYENATPGYSVGLLRRVFDEITALRALNKELGEQLGEELRKNCELEAEIGKLRPAPKQKNRRGSIRGRGLRATDKDRTLLQDRREETGVIFDRPKDKPTGPIRYAPTSQRIGPLDRRAGG